MKRGGCRLRRPIRTTPAIALLMQLVACRTVSAQVASAPVSSCATMGIETSRHLDIPYDPAALLVDDEGNAHVFVWELTYPVPNGRAHTSYTQYTSAGGRWTRTPDIFPGDPPRGALFAYRDGHFFAADGTLLFTGLPWRQVALLPGAVKA